VTVIAVLTNLPDSESAFNLARELVRRRVAACVNVLPAATSFYRWQGKPEEAAEHPVLVKTTQDRYPELESAIRELHPYELPEFVVLEAAASDGYGKWVADSSS